MAGSAADKKKTVLVAAAALTAIAGLGLYARKKQHQALVAQRKQLTNLRFDLSVAQIEQETASIIARMQKIDDEIAATTVQNTNWANVAQKLIDLDHEMLSRVTNVTFLGQVSADKAIRDACTKADELIEDFLVKRGMRADVYKVVRHLQSTPAVRVSLVVSLWPWVERYLIPCHVHGWIETGRCQAPLRGQARAGL